MVGSLLSSILLVAGGAGDANLNHEVQYVAKLHKEKLIKAVQAMEAAARQHPSKFGSAFEAAVCSSCCCGENGCFAQFRSRDMHRPSSIV